MNTEASSLVLCLPFNNQQLLYKLFAVGKLIPLYDDWQNNLLKLLKLRCNWKCKCNKRSFQKGDINSRTASTYHHTNSLMNYCHWYVRCLQRKQSLKAKFNLSECSRNCYAMKLKFLRHSAYTKFHLKTFAVNIWTPQNFYNRANEKISATTQFP